MRRAGVLLIGLSVVTPAWRALEAQSAQAISLQGSGLFNGVFGKVFQGLQNGFGGEAQIRYTPSAFSIGGGFQYTIHNITNATEDAKLYGAFIEPRYRIHTGSYVLAPYVSARFALLKVGFTGGNLSISSNFLQLNGGGGLALPAWSPGESRLRGHLRLRPPGRRHREKQANRHLLSLQFQLGVERGGPARFCGGAGRLSGLRAWEILRCGSWTGPSCRHSSRTPPGIPACC